MIVVKVIPDKIFHILWNNAKKFELLDDYIKYFTSIKSKGYIDFYKECNINEIDIFVTLSNIYKAANLSFKEIVELAGVKKIEISNIFCIPIRTIEDWYAGKSKCNDYIRLMFIRHFELLDLGKHVQNEYKYIKKYKGQIANNVDINSGKVENSKKIEKNIIRKNKRNEKNSKNHRIDNELIENDNSDYNIDSTIDFLERIRKSESTAKILRETDYLDQIMKKNKR